MPTLVMRRSDNIIIREANTANEKVEMLKKQFFPRNLQVNLSDIEDY